MAKPSGADDGAQGPTLAEGDRERPLSDAGRAAFIRTWTAAVPPPLVPELRLHTAEEATDLWQATEDELNAAGLPPPFWAFPWAGGQAVARWLLDHAGDVRGRAVLDFGAGGGLAALAAVKAGAVRAVAVDIDPFAATAQRLNAALNGLAVEVLEADIVGTPAGSGVLAGIDLVVAGDVCYEAAMAGQVLTWLRGLVAAGLTVLLGDPGRTFAPTQGLEELASYQVPTPLALEDRTMRTTLVWRLLAS
ncbi:MAG: methyltransferase [Rhodospirillaceae bacterium]|nr:methyltransferase [Rhodospirillaceae bacterium]